MSSCGFDSLPDQVTTRHTIHGLSFNVLVVGPAGIGKTTLINSLFDFDYGDCPDIEREITDVDLKVREFRPLDSMKLTIIETKGFDNQSSKSHSHKPIIDYVNARYEDFLKDELKVQETRYNDISDNRVHCCIYMIAPIGLGLRAIDLVTMKQLHRKVCLIPVIGKSDVLTEQERTAFKERVRHQINVNGIEIYSPEDHHLPAAVVASNEIFKDNGKRQRVRVYPWGNMYIENSSEFSYLRDLVLKSNMLSLIEHTNRVHYEKYRREVTSDFKTQYELEKAALLAEIEQLQRQLSSKNF